MTKLNKLDNGGFFINDFIVGLSGEDLPTNWTKDLVGDGYYNAQYQGATRNAEGEWAGGNWVETGIIPPVDYLSPAISQRDELMAAATITIAPLQDAVDLDEATDDETALLKKWKQYRVALNRLDLSTAPDITWPVLPTVQTGS
ncbi:phage tail protein [Rahnella sp. AA]|nr:phage tail protein [Rahnella sp. AA]